MSVTHGVAQGMAERQLGSVPSEMRAMLMRGARSLLEGIGADPGIDMVAAIAAGARRSIAACDKRSPQCRSLGGSEKGARSRGGMLAVVQEQGTSCPDGARHMRLPAAHGRPQRKS